MPKLSRIAAFLASLAFLAAGAAAQSDLRLNATSQYVSAARNTPWASLSRAYFFTPLSANIGICVFLVNNNPTSSHNFTLAVAQTGDPQVQGYSGFIGRWISVPNTPVITSVAAQASISTFVQTSAAANVAVVIGGTGAGSGSPDTADVYIVQTDAPGCGSATGGVNLSYGQVKYGPKAGSAYPVPIDLVSGDAGLSIGTFQLTHSELAMNCCSSMEAATSGGYAALLEAPAIFQGGNLYVESSGLYSPVGTLQVSTGGMYAGPTGTVGSTGTPLTIFNISGGQGVYGLPGNCEFQLNVTSITGTAPTFDLWIQTSSDTTNWTDVIHFLQVTPGVNQNQVAAIQSAAIAPVAMQSATLAAGSIVNGQLGPYLRAWGLGGGGTPAITYTIRANCR